MEEKSKLFNLMEFIKDYKEKMNHELEKYQKYVLETSDNKLIAYFTFEIGDCQTTASPITEEGKQFPELYHNDKNKLFNFITKVHLCSEEG
jgi:hypothetical protein